MLHDNSADTRTADKDPSAKDRPKRDSSTTDVPAEETPSRPEAVLALADVCGKFLALWSEAKAVTMA